MSRIAFRRDTEEPEVVRQFASMFSTEEQLKMLVLLTLCDVGAVSPETLTPWKEELLWRLYVDAYNQMTLGYGDDIIDRDQALVAALQANRPADISEAEMARFLEGLPRRYLILFSQDAIYRHVRLSRDIRPNEAHFFLEKKAEAWELTVVSLDKPFLFSNICGVLAYFGMDILRGHALTSPAGLALDVFQFADSDGFFERNSEGPKEFDRRLREVVSGATDVTALLKSKEGSVLARRSLVRRTPVVHFDTRALAALHRARAGRRRRAGSAAPGQPRHLGSRRRRRSRADLDRRTEGHRRISHYSRRVQAFGRRRSVV